VSVASHDALPADRFDVAAVRAQFPVLADDGPGRTLTYLDSAATAQKPQAVIDALEDFYTREYASVHRGVYALSVRSTQRFEAVREKVCRLLHTSDPREVVFTRGTTEAINLVATSWGGQNVSAGDEIVVTQLEHHSNIVPWQLLCERTGARLRVAPIGLDGCVEVDAFEALLGPRTKLVALAHVSNALGTRLPVAALCQLARSRGITSLVDGAQAVPHGSVDVLAIGCDFYAFSAHKVYGPTGTGVLWGRRDLLDAMPPYQGGGSMIRSVSFEGTTYADAPQRFEAGTPDVAGVIGMGAALDWLEEIDREAAAAFECELLRYASEALEAIPGLHIFGSDPEKVGVLSFSLDCAHPHDIATILDREGVAIRAGHHCAQPLMEFYGVPAMARASLALYSDRSDIDALVSALETTREIFS